MEEEEEHDPKQVTQTQQLCRFFSQGRHCNFGSRCKFAHIRAESRVSYRSDMSPALAEYLDPTSAMAPPAANRRPCRYFLAGHCTMDDRCRFWHPPELFSLGEVTPRPSMAQRQPPAQRNTPVPRPAVAQETKLSELTEERAKQLRDTEINQLKKRFTQDRLIIQESDDGKLTYYRVRVEATDPDWPFDLKEIDIMVSFPDDYPREIFTLDVPLDQDLPALMGRHVQQAAVEWLQAKHATNQLMGKVELIFRPFLRWLDRSMEKLFTEGARKLKKDIDLEKAGLQFITYQELQATVSEDSGSNREEDKGGVDEEMEGDGNVEGESTDQQEGLDVTAGQEADEELSDLVENIKISNIRRGTEVKLLGLRLGENTATVVTQQIAVCLQCNRCKITADLTLSGRTPCSAQCEKCSASIRAAFRPCMLHHYCDVLGYLDLHNATPVDLVLQDCDLNFSCLNCSNEIPVNNVSYGQMKELNCESCHNKVTFLAESTRFQYIQPRPNRTGASSATVGYKSVRDPAVQKGKPLPEKGTCKHYKQSHRWLRFPCCGRAYPCDVCHDENQDHPMELASRMICGYCAKEQPYGNGKPCVSCGSMMTRGARTSHWEGGLGCRNKVKMCRNDRQKYANTNKTVSRKASEKK
ncbi:uncharacterized protein ACB058_007957 isoform 2-T2 [Synchiropus picturatus]